MEKEKVERMVDAFLSWPLPKDFNPDGRVSFNKEPDAMGFPSTWPIGTNLFTAAQAREMVEHMLLNAGI